MYKCLKQNPELRNILTSTGDIHIYENSPYDSYWGVGKDGNGKNILGKLLMQLRRKYINYCIQKIYYIKINDNLHRIYNF